jgi:hypothetical protein
MRALVNRRVISAAALLLVLGVLAVVARAPSARTAAPLP